MPLTNAEKQRRFRERNVVLLTADARAIAQQLIDMPDQKKAPERRPIRQRPPAPSRPHTA